MYSTFFCFSLQILFTIYQQRVKFTSYHTTKSKNKLEKKITVLRKWSEQNLMMKRINQVFVFAACVISTGMEIMYMVFIWQSGKSIETPLALNKLTG